MRFFIAAHELREATVVSDAALVSQAIATRSRSTSRPTSSGERIPEVPYQGQGGGVT
jgi:hypothetical protein